MSKVGKWESGKLFGEKFDGLGNLDKFLTLKNENKISFSLLNRNFALSLQAYLEN